MLRVETEDEKAYLYFQAGSVINAMNSDRQEGEDAAKHVFAMKRAQFQFTTDLPSVAHRITCSTQSLMMEVARLLDEESADGEAGPSHGDLVRDAQFATEQLNRIFSQIDTDSKILAHRSHQGFGISDLIAAIRETPGSTLFLREGAPPEVRVGGRMIAISETRIDRRSYEDLRDHLLREAAGRIERIQRDDDFVLSLGDDGCYRIEVLRHVRPEILLMRRTVGGDAPDLPWPAEVVDGFLAPAGSIVLLVGTDVGATRRAFESLVSHAIPNAPGPVVGLARQWPPKLAAARAAVTLLTRTRRDEIDRALQLVDPMEPELFILDSADDPACLRAALRAMQCGSRVIVTVTSRSPALGVHRIGASLDEIESHTLRLHLSWGLTGVLLQTSDDHAHAIPVDDETRAAVGNGDADVWPRFFHAALAEPDAADGG